jgi:hypothetical protein
MFLYILIYIHRPSVGGVLAKQPGSCALFNMLYGGSYVPTTPLHAGAAGRLRALLLPAAVAFDLVCYGGLFIGGLLGVAGRPPAPGMIMRRYCWHLHGGCVYPPHYRIHLHIHYAAHFARHHTQFHPSLRRLHCNAPRTTTTTLPPLAPQSVFVLVMHVNIIFIIIINHNYILNQYNS